MLLQPRSWRHAPLGYFSAADFALTSAAQDPHQRGSVGKDDVIDDHSEADAGQLFVGPSGIAALVSGLEIASACL